MLTNDRLGGDLSHTFSTRWILPFRVAEHKAIRIQYADNKRAYAAGDPEA